MIFPPFAIPPIPYWLWQRYLLLLDESTEVGVINGMNYRGAGVVADILGASSYGTVTVSEASGGTPPEYESRWFSLYATSEFATFPGALLAERVVVDTAWDQVVFQTSHPDFYQYDNSTGRIYNYASGSNSANLYYTSWTTSLYFFDDLCAVQSGDSKYYIRAYPETWIGSPPSLSNSGYLNLGGYNIQRAGCNTHYPDGGSDVSGYFSNNFANAMTSMQPPIYPGYTRFSINGVKTLGTGAIALPHVTGVYLKYTNYPYFHIPPEYQ